MRLKSIFDRRTAMTREEFSGFRDQKVRLASRRHVSRRDVLAVLGFGLAGSALAACTGVAPESTRSPAPAQAIATMPTNAPSPAPPTVAASPSQTVSGPVTWLVRTNLPENRGQETIFEPLIKERIPGVTVTRIVIPTDQGSTKINSMAAANTSLELWGFGGNYMDYWARRLPQNLDSYIIGDKWDLKAYFLPGLPEIYNVKGHQYGLPQLTTYGSNLVYNKDLFDAAGLQHPPLDWEDRAWNMDAMLVDALKLTKGYGAPDATYGISMGLWDQMTSLAYLWGGDSWLPEHYTNFIAPKTNFGAPENVAAHQYRQDLIYQHKVHPDPAIEQGMNQFANPFKTGRIAMLMDGGWQYWATSDITAFKVGVAPVPWSKTNNTINFDDFWIMGRWAKNKDGAWAVLRVLTSVDATTRYSLLSGTPPTPRAATEPWAAERAKFFGLTLDEMTKMLAQSIDQRTQESPDHLFLQYPKMSDTYSNEIAALWNHADVTAAMVIPQVTTAIDQVVLGIHTQFKDSLPTE